jgi:hypothetical protein
MGYIPGSGAATGAAIGSVVPGVGTVIGGVVGSVADFITSIFGNKNTYGSDFQNRINQFQAWLSTYNLTGQLKYVDPQVIQTYLFENVGWQDDIQQYLANLSNYLNGKPMYVSPVNPANGGVGGKDWSNEIISYVKKQQYASDVSSINPTPPPTSTSTGTYYTPTSSPLPTGTSNTASLSNPLILILLFGAGLFLLSEHHG